MESEDAYFELNPRISWILKRKTKRDNENNVQIDITIIQLNSIQLLLVSVLSQQPSGSQQEEHNREIQITKDNKQDIGKGKGKVLPTTGHEGPGGSRGIALSLTLALDGGGWSTPRPGRFTPGKETRYPFYRRLGGPQGRSGRLRKISPPPGFDPRTVQHIESRYTDCAIPAQKTVHSCIKQNLNKQRVLK